MKKFLFAIAVFILSVLCSVIRPVQASVGDTFAKNNINYKVISESENGGEVKMISVVDDLYDSVSVPEQVVYEDKTYTVTSLADAAFATLKVKEVILPDTVKRIGISCFFKCRKLNHLRISPDTEYIGAGAFSYCEKLDDIEYDGEKGVFIIQDKMILSSDKSVVIGSLAPAGHVVVPEGVTQIADFAFEGAVSLTSIDLPNTLSSIGNGAFCKCISLSKLTIPADVNKMGYNPFMYCNNLDKLKISKSNTAYVIKDGFILSTKTNNIISAMNVSGEVSIPETVRKIKQYAFCGNTKITGIVIPAKFKSIGSGAFYGCKGLTYVGFEKTGVKLENGTKIFGNTNHFLEVNIPYSDKGRSEYIKKLEPNCPSGTIFSGR